jgi:hypothetical protein
MFKIFFIFFSLIEPAQGYSLQTVCYPLGPPLVSLDYYFFFTKIEYFLETFFLFLFFFAQTSPTNHFSKLTKRPFYNDDVPDFALLDAKYYINL